eukprot:1148663-Pelagomonas_calceolata.AAC.2
MQLSDACAWPLADALGVDARIDVDVTGSPAPPYLAYNMRYVVLRCNISIDVDGFHWVSSSSILSLNLEWKVGEAWIRRFHWRGCYRTSGP